MKIKYSSLSLIAAGLLSACVLNGCVTALVGATAGTAGAIIGSDSRTIDKIVYDDIIERDVHDILKAEISTSDRYDRFSVDCVAICGNVLLVGQTQDQDYLRECIDKIRDVEHVRRIYNWVENTAPVGASVIASDTYITSKVKSALLFGEQISSGRFKVYTENSNVFLMGYVTQDEAKRAINQTKKVSGINHIYYIFDYMDAVNETSDVKVINSDGSTSAVSSTTSGRNSSVISQQTQSTADNGGASIVNDDSDLLAPSAPANW